MQASAFSWRNHRRHLQSLPSALLRSVKLTPNVPRAYCAYHVLQLHVDPPTEKLPTYAA